MRIDAHGLHYRELNARIKEAVSAGTTSIQLKGVNGQRYIGSGVNGRVKITVDGVPGNDLAAFMDGPQITVLNNAQDVVSNTMNSGKVVIHGHAGDVLAYGMRGGRLHILGDVGYRVGIHMKAYKNHVPVVIIGGRAGDFFGEYMAGGVLILLGLEENGEALAGDYCGTGMHGGVIYIRGEVDPFYLGREVKAFALSEEDRAELRSHLEDFCLDFGLNLDEVLTAEFTKLLPVTHRPYGKLYTY